jgi:hypothetical protein
MVRIVHKTWKALLAVITYFMKRLSLGRVNVNSLRGDNVMMEHKGMPEISRSGNYARNIGNLCDEESK